MSPVAHALVARGITPTLAFTGQHWFDPAEFGLDSFPSFFLQCSDKADPHAHVRAVTYAFIPLLSYAPRLIIVPRDSSSALGAALAAFTCGISVAHIDAGLRSRSSAPPWPEEEYRSAIDAHADLLFAPNKLAAENLYSDGVHGEIHVIGLHGPDHLAGIIASWLEERSLTRLLA